MPAKDRASVVSALAVTAMALAAACGGEKAASTSAPPPDARRVDEAKAGSVAGRVLLEGTPPANPTVRMAADPACTRDGRDTVTLETVLVSNGGLENVFVYLKDGLGTYYFDVPTDPVKLDQKGCEYHPHVFGARLGQPIEISNSDPTMHNVHAIPNINQEFNFSQALPGLKNRRTFTAREVMVPFKCEVHGWMRAYAGVLEHPYFAVTSTGGKFELRGVPSGTYTLEAWHEKLGTATETVTLGEKEHKEVTFTLKASATAN